MDQLTEVWIVQTENDKIMGVFRYYCDAKTYQSRSRLVTTITQYPVRILP